MKIVALLLALLCPAAWSQALNPDVTQATIRTTICVPGWTATVRPPTGYTNALKRRLLRQAGIPLPRAGEYELDHVVPLATGGAPRDPRNLRLQAWTGADGAHAKDVIEREMQLAVCAGRVTLADARACMASNFRQCKVR